MPYATIDSIRIRYEVWGEGSTPLLLLHGLGSCADDWLLQLPAFGPHYRCIALDLRGHGLSDKPPGPYSVEIFAGDVAGLLRQLGAAPAHVVGLSLGGLVAQRLAIAHGELVRSLVLINTFPGLWPPTRAVLRNNWRRLPGMLRRPSMAETATRVAWALFPHAGQELMRGQCEARLAQNDPLGYREASRAILRFRPGPAALRAIACPVLLISGEEDRVVPHTYKERLHGLLPGSRLLVVPGSGHASNIDAAEVVNRAVLDFVLGVERQAEGGSSVEGAV